ncbi:MAG: peptidylprolyl isomerase [Candidatus Midichloriaceae bacterium]|jgi:peptidylprolyl isomerase
MSLTPSKLNATVKENDLIELDLKYGKVIIELYSDKAPKHVQRIKEFCNEGFYNGLKFHRVIENFMVQTGDPRGNGTGASEKPNLKAEFNDIQHKRGVVSMARSSDPDSANSQFFIVLDDATYLDGEYTAFGKVVQGMEFIDMIKKGDSSNNGIVTNPDTIVKMSVLKK